MLEIDQIQRPSELAALAYLARYENHTHQLYARHLRCFFGWCERHNLDPLRDVERVHVELYVRHLSSERGNLPSTINNCMSAVKGYYQMALLDGRVRRNPAEHAHLPRVYRDPAKFLGLDRLELSRLLAIAPTVSPQHGALVYLMSLLAMRVSAACAVQIEDYRGVERGYRVLRTVGKGGRPSTKPLTVPLLRSLENAQGQRSSGPLLTRKKDGRQLDRATAAWMVSTVTRRAGIDKHVTPHTLRRSAITCALDAGVALRDVQGMADHADPRTTMLYDTARNTLERHATHVLTAFVAG